MGNFGASRSCPRRYQRQRNNLSQRRQQQQKERKQQQHRHVLDWGQRGPRELVKSCFPRHFIIFNVPRLIYSFFCYPRWKERNMIKTWNEGQKKESQGPRERKKNSTPLSLGWNKGEIDFFSNREINNFAFMIRDNEWGDQLSKVSVFRRPRKEWV